MSAGSEKGKEKRNQSTGMGEFNHQGEKKKKKKKKKSIKDSVK